jgi:diacylglycerol kinase (ATP)
VRATVLYNPNAGDGEISAEVVLTAVQAAGLKATLVSTKDKKFVETLAEPTDIVVAAGGDGTVARVIRHLPDRDIPIAILPLGGANNIARTFGIIGPWQRLPAGWSRAKKVSLDVGAARGPWGLHMLIEGIGVGPVARTIESGVDHRDPKKKMLLGRKTLRKMLQKEEPHGLRIWLDGKELSDETLMFEALNIRYTGSSLKLAPRADPGDGLLDILCINARDRRTMLKWLETPHAQLPKSIKIQRGRKLKIEWQDVPLHLDDKLPKPPDSKKVVTVKLERDPVKILAPPGFKP